MSGKVTIAGIHTVLAVLRYRPERLLELWVSADRKDQRMDQLLDLAKKAGANVQRVKRQELDKRADDKHHQGVVASVRPATPGTDQQLSQLLDKLDAPPFLLVLDGVTDPHNLGACLRSADAAGVHAVITPRDRSAHLNPTVDRVSSGASQVLPLFQVTNLARCLKSLQQRGIWLTGLAGEASDSLYEANLQGPVALIMGAEGQGLRRLTRDTCDHLVRIPMAGQVESLNVSVAAGVCLFEALRQRI